MDVLLSSEEGQKAARTFLYALPPSNLLAPKPAKADNSFPKSVRLRKRAEFLRLTGSAQKFAARGLLVVWQSGSLDHARLGITVSKKIGSAVIRNRFKRYMREIFRNLHIMLPPVDVNIIARRESVSMDFNSLQQELENAFRYIGPSPCSRVSHSS
jgi:ribonuclease P protein component